MGRFAGICVLLICALGGCAAAAVAAAEGEAAPSCAEGPRREGEMIVGTPCADRIVAPPAVAKVEGGGGDDTIVAAAALESCPAGCFLGVGSQTFEGGPGDDLVFGQRGNDRLRGGEGNDRLYGGIGDDLVLGGPGDDLLAGGFGADTIDGEEGSDEVRGDGTIDHIFDRGVSGTDTLSYATGVTPGFGAGQLPPGVAGFPSGPEGERGVHLDLTADAPKENGNDGIAALGGGVDEVQLGAFERIVGSAYADYIEGSESGETIEGGGGADAIFGNGGNDTLRGGADGDYLDGGSGSDSAEANGLDRCQGVESDDDCGAGPAAVDSRPAGEVSVGRLSLQPGPTQLYLSGSDGADTVTATYSPAAVTFALAGASFDESDEEASGCSIDATTAVCPTPGALDSLVLAGLGEDDTLSAGGFPATVGLVLSGGTGSDELGGGSLSEDTLVDGADDGADEESASGGDDALLHNGGRDTLRGGDGNDLFLSVSICDGETIDGEAGRDNSSWARFGGDGVAARLDQGRVGQAGTEDEPQCPGDDFDQMLSIEDLEGSSADTAKGWSGADVFFGDDGPNQLLGHSGADRYRAGGGDDSILANSGDTDLLVDCGEGSGDTALIDRRPQYQDPDPVDCEAFAEADPNSFAPPVVPPGEPEPEPEPQPPAGEPPPKPPNPPRPPKPPRDRIPPATRLTAHPAHLVLSRSRSRRVVFRFSADELGSSFRCRLDARPYRPCSSPRSLAVGNANHAFRVFALDPSGNRDPTPATFRFRVRQR